MKLDFCGMDSNSGQPKSVLGMGIRSRKLHRYDLDDFAQSMTPTAQEGLYFPKGTLPKESICDRITKELEVAENGTGSLTAKPWRTDIGHTEPTGSLSVSLSGIHLSTPQPQSPVPEIITTEEAEAPPKPNLERRRKSSLLEGKHLLDREVLLRAFQSFGPPPADPVTAPSLPKVEAIPHPKLRVRKTSAPPSLNPMTMEPHSNFANFFFRGQSSQLPVPREEGMLSKSDQALNEQAPADMNPSPVRQKRTRKVYKKNSQFAELNVFCPPSM